MIRLFSTLVCAASLSGCGAATVPIIAAVGGAASGFARLDIAALDTIESWEGRKAQPVAQTCPLASPVETK